MADTLGIGCPKCEEAAREAEALRRRVAELEAELAKAKKNSATSSKPPSSDIVKPPKPKGSGKDGKRKQGAQPGHERHERTPFSSEDLDLIVEHRFDCCSCCGGKLKDIPEPPKVFQQVDLLPHPILITEHRQIAQECQDCHKVHYAGLPEELAKAGLIGPRLTAMIGFLKGACHMSFSSIRTFFRDVIGVRVSRGLLAKLIQKVSDSLELPYEELLLMLPKEGSANIDETGHKDQKVRFWTWCFRAATFTLFKISPSRGTKVLLEVLGKEFSGVIGCDYYAAYRKYMRLNENVLVQFCLAHLIRDAKFLAQHPNPENRAYGQRLVETLRKLFGIIHRKDEYASPLAFQQALHEVEQEFCWNVVMESPGTREADNLGNRFCNHAESFFRFITNPDIKPTNNLAEQAIRFVAIQRRITQGTRGEPGRKWCERIWTVVATCTQQGRSIYDFVQQSVNSFLSGAPPPSLASVST